MIVLVPLLLLLRTTPTLSVACGDATNTNLYQNISDRACSNCFFITKFADCVSCRNYSATLTYGYSVYCYPRGAEAAFGIDLALCTDPCNTTGETHAPTPPNLPTGGAVCPGRNNTFGCSATPDNCALFNAAAPNCRFCPHESPCPVCVAATDNCYAPDPNNVHATIVDPDAGPSLATTGTIVYVAPPTLAGVGVVTTTAKTTIATALAPEKPSFPSPPVAAIASLVMLGAASVIIHVGLFVVDMILEILGFVSDLVTVVVLFVTRVINQSIKFVHWLPSDIAGSCRVQVIHPLLRRKN